MYVSANFHVGEKGDGSCASEKERGLRGEKDSTRSGSRKVVSGFVRERSGALGAVWPPSSIGWREDVDESYAGAQPPSQAEKGKGPMRRE